jgi:PIN domain nuclease of toxin-antitoxin system
MSNYVFDSSAVLAILRAEPGSSAAKTLIADAAAKVSISAVNWCEIVTKLSRDGQMMPPPRRS